MDDIQTRLRESRDAERRTMNTEPALKSQRIKDLRHTMGQCLNTMNRGAGSVAIDQFLTCVELMIEAKLDVKNEGRE